MHCLLESGVCVCQQDCNGNNIAHNLITQIFYYPDQEEVIVANFKTLLNNINLESQKEMLYTENMFGLRPIEFAAQHGCYKMFQTIMDTPNIYLYKVEIKGLAKYTWYNITDYEGFHPGVRSSKSPLLLLTFADKGLIGEGWCQLTERQYMKKWSRSKFIYNLPFLLMLMFIRLIYIVSWFVLDMDTSWYDDYQHSNATTFCRPNYTVVLSKDAKFWISVYLVCHSGLIIILDVYENIMIFGKAQWAVWSTISGKKSLRVQFFFYRWSNFIFAVFVTCYVVVHQLNTTAANVPFLDYMRVVCPALAAWSFMYFIQLVPSIGYFVITIQVMQKDLLHFFIIYFVIPFMHSFQIVVNSNTKLSLTAMPSLKLFKLFTVYFESC